MKDLAIWIGIWFFIWTIFNVFFRWKTERYKSKKFMPRGLYFLGAFFVVYLLYKNLLGTYLNQIFIAFLISNFLGLSLSLNRGYYKKFSKDRFFILFQSFNILFQQSAIVTGIILLQKMMGANYKDLHFGIFFFTIHLLLVFLPWVKLKYYLVAGCFLGGWLFSYLINNFSYGLVASFTIHYFIYIWEIYYLKDEEKI
jgi:hypothetical protein